jgi:hypothetical protein
VNSCRACPIHDVRLIASTLTVMKHATSAIIDITRGKTIFIVRNHSKQSKGDSQEILVSFSLMGEAPI